MEHSTQIMLATLAIFNVATIWLLTVALKRVDIPKAMSEKAAPPDPALAAAGGGGGGGGAGAGGGAAPPPDTSYSRVSGMIGAVVLAVFFWAVGNVIVFKAFVAPKDIADLLNGVGTFFAGGAALFLPYAANQVREAFKPRA